MEKNNQVQGDIYQISNKQTLGITEQEIVQNVKVIVQKNNRTRKTSKKIISKRRIRFRRYNL